MQFDDYDLTQLTEGARCECGALFDTELQQTICPKCSQEMQMSNHQNESSAGATLARLAKEWQAANPGKSYFEALRHVQAAAPALTQAYLGERHANKATPGSSL